MKVSEIKVGDVVRIMDSTNSRNMEILADIGMIGRVLDIKIECYDKNDKTNLDETVAEVTIDFNEFWRTNTYLQKPKFNANTATPYDHTWAEDRYYWRSNKAGNGCDTLYFMVEDEYILEVVNI